MILSYTDENGERVTPTKSTGLPVKGNKKRAEAMLNDWRKSEEIALEKRKASGGLKNCLAHRKSCSHSSCSIGWK